MRKKFYAVSYSVQFLDKPDAFLDSHFAELCQARNSYAYKLAKISAEPKIYRSVLIMPEGDISRRYVESDELCQCCETKLAKLVKAC